MRGPSHGAIIINSNGTFTYTPTLNYYGVDTIVISICDAGLPLPALCVNDTLIININPVNDPPVITNDAITINEDNGYTGTVLTAGDYDPDGTVLTVNTTPVTGPNHGIIIINSNGTFTYTPTLNYNGTDTVVISVCDSGLPLPAICVNDTLIFTISSVNDAPVIANETITINEDSVLSSTFLTGADYDPDGTVLTANTTPVRGPSHGAIIINSNGTFTYTPTLNYYGVDTIVISICDAGLPLPALCVNDTLIININPVNDPPVITNDAITINEDNGYTGTVLTAGDYDPDGTVLTVNTTPVTGPNHGIIIINSNGTFTYTPTLNYNGTDTVVISVCDSGLPLPAICVNDTLIFTISSVNDAPVIANETIITNEDVVLNGTFLTAADYDPDGTALTANTTPVSGPSHGAIIINSNGTFTYTPSLNFNGADTIVISICDAGLPLPALCVNDTLIITVNAVNDTLIVANDYITTNEDFSVSGNVITVADYDPDGTTLTANTTPVAGPYHGVISINTNGSFTYTPSADYFGEDTVVISICDSGFPLPAICLNDTLFITINPFNEAPIIGNDAITTDEDTPVSGTILTAADWDPDFTILKANTTPVAGPYHGIININTDGTYTYTPSNNYYGIDTVIIAVCDSGVPLPALCVNDTLIITINPVNDTLIVANDNIVTNEDVPVSGNVITAADYDPDNTTLTANTVAVAGPYHGTININSNGSYTYTPASNYYGEDTVVISICDAGLPMPAICLNDTLFITVNPVNDPPVIANNTVVTNEDNPVSGTILSVGDYDPDGTTLTVNTTPVAGPYHGIIIINSDGTYTYTPSPNYYGTDTIIIAVCDSGFPLPAICVNNTLVITINSVNDLCNANNDTTDVCSDATLVVNPLANDTDIDGDSLFISAIVQPSNGTASTNGITITYTPNAGYFGPDSILYTVCDNGIPQLCSNAMVYIDVHGLTSINILASEVLCYGGSTGSVSTTPTGNSPFTYAWSNSATTRVISNIPAGTYWVTITDSLGCSAKDTAIVSQPSAPISINAIVTDARCFGDNSGAVSINVSGGTSPYTYQWNNSDTTQNLSQASAGNYTLVVTDAYGCMDSVNSTVSQPVSTISIASTMNASNCLNNTQGSIDITVSGGSPGYSYSWSNGQLTEDISDIAGSYTVIVTDIKNCLDSTTINITDNSSFVISTTDSLMFCVGDSALLTSATSAASYQWYESGNVISGATSVNFVATQSGNYTMTINGTCGTLTSNSITVSVASPPSLTIIGTTEICYGSSIALFASGATNYVWTPSASLLNPNSANPSASPLVTTTYSVTGYNQGCSSDTQTTIIVHPLPVVNITAGPYDCKKGSQLMATGGNSYLWMPITGLDFSNIANPVAIPGVSTTYIVVARDSNLCSNSDTIDIRVNCDSLGIPSGISPDNDGVNDAWVIDGLDRYPGNNLKIFNRWGNIVYGARPYNNDWKGNCTTGGTLIGDQLPDGTYYYILELGEAGKPTRTGYIEIRR